MSIIGILLVLLILVAAFYLVANYVPQPYSWVCLVVLAVITIIWVVKVLGLGGAITGAHT